MQVTTNISNQLVEVQNKLAYKTGECRELIKRNDELEEKLKKVKTMLLMYSAIKKEVANEIVSDIDETLGDAEWDKNLKV